MAVNPEDSARDMAQLDFRAFDERVEMQGWVFYVRGVRYRRELLLGARQPGEVLTSALVAWVIGHVLRRPWKIGIVRRGAIQTWNDEHLRIVHCETLPADVDPTARIAELAERVRSGEFLPD